jgi:hypothetical protein
MVQLSPEWDDLGLLNKNNSTQLHTTPRGHPNPNRNIKTQPNTPRRFNAAQFRSEGEPGQGKAQ